MSTQPPEAGRRRRALLLVNANARNGAADLNGIHQVLMENGIEPFQPDEEDFVECIRKHAGSCDLAILGGGDGTLNAVAAALLEAKLPFGILPLGTANDLARSLGLPEDPVEAARVLSTMPARPIDLGVVNGHHFFNVASVGFSADLAGELTADLKKRWGTIGYAVAAFRLLRKARPFRAWIEHDGRIEKITTIQVSVGNGRHYGGGMTVAENACVDDGKLRFYSLEVKHWWRLLALLPALRRGTQGEAADVRAFETTEIVIKTRKPRPINTDGELTTHTPAKIRILPGAILVHAPEHVPFAEAADLAA